MLNNQSLAGDYSDRPFLEELGWRVLVFDGAMGTCIQDANLTAADFEGKDGCNEYLAVVRPDVIERIHAAFLEAGCDVIETDSFGGSRLKLDEYGLGERAHEINFAAARLGRGLADRFSAAERPRFVAGAVGPTGMLPSTDDARARRDQLRRARARSSTSRSAR